MSLFSNAFSQMFVPLLLHWHGDPVRYLPLDDEDGKPIEVCKALVSDEVRQRRRVNEFEVDTFTIRHVQLVTDKDHADFCGVSKPQQNALMEIVKGCECFQYVIESVSDGDHGMAKLQLKRTNRVTLAGKETISQ